MTLELEKLSERTKDRKSYLQGTCFCRRFYVFHVEIL